MNHLGVFNRTIIALATAPVNQNIAIVRVSGPETYRIISQVFSGKIPNPSERKRKLVLGKITRGGQLIDEVLLSCFYSPSSFTGEDTVEINCHGNLIIVNQILELLLSKGAQMATAGEFSKKAFFNNKLSLTQATAINDLIRAPSISAVKLALENFDSRRQLALEALIEKLFVIIAKVEVNIDYPEYEDIEKITIDKLGESVNQLITEVRALGANCRRGRVLSEGLKIGIFGKTNVGKSTLLNQLVREEKAIVTPVAGTTRDVIETEYEIGGLPVRFFDTAGVRRTRNEIEKKGIEKTYKLAGNLDLSLLVVDISKKWTKEDEEILSSIKKGRYLIVANKNDLRRKMTFPATEKNIVSISAESASVGELEARIVGDFLGELSGGNSPYPFLTNPWQQSRITIISEKLQQLSLALRRRIPVDVLAGDLQVIFRTMRELSGRDYDEDLLEMIFSRFCLGK